MRIILGSGKVYMAEFTGAIPGNSALEVAGNMIGAVKAARRSPTNRRSTLQRTILEPSRSPDSLKKRQL